MNSHDPEQTENSRWPSFPMLFFGTFGTKTPAERRLIIRSWLAAAVCIGWVLIAFAIHFRPKPLIGLSIPCVLGVMASYIAWEFRRYLSAIDELARRMQLEAMAWTYLTGFVLAGWLGVLTTLMYSLTRWPLVLVIPFLYFLLEPVRAGWLYYLSRKY